MKIIQDVKFVVFGCRFNTRRFLLNLFEKKLFPQLVITLDPEMVMESYCGYENLLPLCAKYNVPVYLCEKYSLQDNDLVEIKKLGKNFDIGLSVGWQRLIPNDLLNYFKYGVFGMHGSHLPLPKGRGCSPQVWSIIKGGKDYYAHIFQYAAGVDDGKIFYREVFDITPNDLAVTLQIKSQMVFNAQIETLFKQINEGEVQLKEQDKSIKATYFPKRTPEDGLINWNQSADQIVNFVRAQKTPYPGAYTYLGAQKIKIEEVCIFDTRLEFLRRIPCGEIIDMLEGLDFIVSTKDHPLWVRKWYGADRVFKGNKFSNSSQEELNEGI